MTTESAVAAAKRSPRASVPQSTAVYAAHGNFELSLLRLPAKSTTSTEFPGYRMSCHNAVINTVRIDNKLINLLKEGKFPGQLVCSIEVTSLTVEDEVTSVYLEELGQRVVQNRDKISTMERSALRSQCKHSVNDR